MAKDTYLKKVLGEDRYERLRDTRVLMVGAGGIGCELIKDIILTGYGEIHIVDLDTITLSNLNRQFLFRQKDIDKSKSGTVVKAVQSFNYFNAKLVPHHGNIMNTEQFPVTWWRQFDYVFNALDNLEARRYVNKMCLFLKLPLMESGTTGYDGQVQPILPYASECFECQAKATPKTFPVCTIRSTPSKPIHCITWAKEFLIHQLFDESVAEFDLKDLENETDDKKEIENMLKESNELGDLRKSIHESNSLGFVDSLITKIFEVDIERLLLIDSLWKSRVKPIPLNYGKYKEELHSMLEDLNYKSILSNETKVWSVLENLYVLLASAVAMQKRLLSGKEGFITFDKDDEDTLNFVSAASNLRSYSFSIEAKTKFDIKQIAGNIIPAIATTNAIISGFSSLGSLTYFDRPHPAPKDFSEVMRHSSTVFISIRPNKYITSASVVGPSPTCATCSLLSRGFLEITSHQLKLNTLQDLVDNIVKKYDYEELSIVLGKSNLIYDPDFEDNLDRHLNEIKGFQDGEILLIQDENDDLESLELYITEAKSQVKDYLPDVKIRPKTGVLSERSTSPDYDNNTFVGSDTIVVDSDNNEDGLIELEEPSLKKRKLN